MARSGHAPIGKCDFAVVGDTIRIVVFHNRAGYDFCGFREDRANGCLDFQLRQTDLPDFFYDSVRTDQVDGREVSNLVSGHNAATGVVEERIRLAGCPVALCSAVAARAVGDTIYIGGHIPFDPKNQRAVVAGGAVKFIKLLQSVGVVVVPGRRRPGSGKIDHHGFSLVKNIVKVPTVALKVSRREVRRYRAIG